MLDWMLTAPDCLPIPNVDCPELCLTETIAVIDINFYKCVWLCGQQQFPLK